MIPCATTISAESKKEKCDPSLELAQMQHTPPKGRLQDAGAAQTRIILALGNKAIPMLIACLTDETKTKDPIEDYWPVTTVGDVAFFYLCDLFTDSTGHPTISGVVDWKKLETESPNSPSWNALYEFVKRHGRRYIQDDWSKKWNEEQSALFWDARERCFKIGHSTA